MGVVRREDQWRLEKQGEGLYEVTYQRQPQARIITPAYSPGMMDNASFAPVSVHEVDSYAEAEGLFEEHAQGGPPAGMASISGGRSSPLGSASEGVLGLDTGGGDRDGFSLGGGDGGVLADAETISPGGLALVCLLAGGLVLSISGFASSDPMFLIGAGIVGLGITIVAWAAFLGWMQGWREAVEFLVTVDEEVPSSTAHGSDTSDEPKPTPPAPEKLKNELIFGRAEQECEWCGEFLDNPEVHHIEPRSEGGPNEATNLIVLCPTCHQKADKGGISQTKLRGKLRHILTEQP